MKRVIIGTAGHVDHGKTALIKAITGIETDRLKEEKKRGITIELGFAHFDLPSGEKVGIIDVPGHEKFVGNMLAGAGGIDLALLIVAADDGVMPQTREHLGILSLLGISCGIVVITKADLVQEDWISLVKEDIKKLTEGTFLEDAPILTVSAYTGEGLNDLRGLIAEKASAVSAKTTSLPFRVPVDRVFSVDGFGTVITGTMIEGVLRVGDEVEIYPSGLRTRVRTLQVHSEDVEEAFAGQRVAVNLAGMRREELARGAVLAQPGSMENTLMLDVKLQVLPSSPRIVENGSRMHFFHGARELLSKVVLLDRDRLGPGEECYAQLRFTEEVAAKKDDRFVVRFFSPVETVGGGTVLDAAPPKRRRRNQKAIDSLAVREHGTDADRLLQAIHDGSPGMIELNTVRLRLSLSDDDLREALEALTRDGRIVPLGERRAVSADWLDAQAGRLRELLRTYHKENPLQAGMRRDELRGRLLPGRDSSAADAVLAQLEKRGAMKTEEGRASLPDFAPKRDELSDKIEALFREARYTPPGMEDLSTAFPKAKNLKKQLEAMLAAGTLTAVAPQIYFHREIMDDALAGITRYITQNGEITLAQFRDLSGTSRKFALALLEYFDRHGITKKIGDARVLAKK